MAHAVPKAFGGLLFAAAFLSSALADPPAEVQTRPDPFRKPSLIDAGRMASSWSSLPEGRVCAAGDLRLSGHAMPLARDGLWGWLGEVDFMPSSACWKTIAATMPGPA
jgi:hypothetical protein